MRNLILRNAIRAFASEAGQGAKPTATTAAAPPPPPKVDPLKNVTGLSQKIVSPNDQKQVPGTGKDYLNVNYFGYNKMSFAEAEVEMEKFRIPQPVAPRK